MTATKLLDPGPLVELSPEGHPQRTIRWGQAWQVGTPAYWVAMTQSAESRPSQSRTADFHRIGRSLPEEIAACMLGGYGIPHEVGLAAFRAVRDSGMLERAPEVAEIESVLCAPLRVGERSVRYRFPAQKARFLAAALSHVHRSHPPDEPLALREWLLQIPGVGPKTSGWIVRNYLDSDDVAIIDIHVYRAGVDAGVFESGWTPQRDYKRMEALFLSWAAAGSVRAANLDAVIWSERARQPNAYVGKVVG